MADKSVEEEVNLTEGDKLLAKQLVEKPYLEVKEYGTRSFISKEDEDEIRKIYAVIRKNSKKCCEIPWNDDIYCGRRISCSCEDDDEIQNILHINTMTDIDPIYTMTTRPNSCLHQNSEGICRDLQGSYSSEDDEIKDTLNSNTFDENSKSNMPFRQNSKCIFREIKLKIRDGNNYLKITNKPFRQNSECLFRKIKLKIRDGNNYLKITNKISLNKSCETITENIMNRNDDCCSQADDVISTTTQSLDGPKEPLFPWTVDFSDETHGSLSKNTCTDNAVNKRKRTTKNISKDVEVMGSTDEGDLCGKRFKIKPSNESKRSSSYKRTRIRIKEKYFDPSTIKTPMNDARSPFFIDQKLVKFYQECLSEGRKSSEIADDMCSTLKWAPPRYTQVHHSERRGYRFGITIQGYRFVAKKRGINMELAKLYASDFFLHYLGFEFSSDYGSEKSPKKRNENQKNVNDL